MGDEYIFMIGLRKVVNLKIYDLPKNEVIIKKDGNESKTFGYSYETTYYIGNGELFKTKRNSEKKSLISRRFSDDHLINMIRSNAESAEELDMSLNSDGNGFMYFSEKGTKIVYYGERKEELKNKLLARRK